MPPSTPGPFSVPDDLGEAWDDMVQRNRVIQALTDPDGFGLTQDLTTPDLSDDGMASDNLPVAEWMTLRNQQVAGGAVPPELPNDAAGDEGSSPDSTGASAGPSADIQGAVGDDQLVGGEGDDDVDAVPSNPLEAIKAATEDAIGYFTAKDANGNPLHPIGHSGPLGEILPFYPSLRNGLSDAQTGDWGGAGLNALGFLGDAGATALGAGALEAAEKGLLWKSGKVSANAANRMMRRKLGLAGTEAGLDKEVHHVFGLRGISRNAENWRNQFPFLKVMDKSAHRRMTGSWQGLPKFTPWEAAWHGTPTWMKVAPTVPLAVADHVGGAIPNSTAQRPQPSAPPHSPFDLTRP